MCGVFLKWPEIDFLGNLCFPSYACEPHKRMEKHLLQQGLDATGACDVQCTQDVASHLSTASC